MTMKYRAQILLEPEQHKTLQKIAKQEGRSLSDVARELIGRGLEARESEAEAIWRKRIEALERLKLIRENVQKQHGTLPGDLLWEARAERSDQMDDSLGWKPKS